MSDPRWAGPPETIAAMFEAGSPDSVITNNVVWLTETVNHGASLGLSGANTAATAAQWQGVGAVASETVVTALNAGLQTLVGWTAEKIAITQAAVDAFMLARSTVIPSLVSQTNRDEWTVLNSTNFLGQNTPVIVDRDTEYFGEHWPHNSGVGWTYAGALSALIAALAVPPPVTPMGASPAAPATAGEALTQAATQIGMSNGLQVSTGVAQSAGQAASSPADGAIQLGSLMQQPLQMLQGATEPLNQMLQAPSKIFESVGNLPQSLMQSMGGMFPATAASNAGAVAAEPLLTGGGTAAGGGGGFPGAGLTSYTRPTSSFELQSGGRPTGLRAGVLNAAEMRSPTAATGIGGAPMPMSPAGMLARESGSEPDKDVVSRARVVVDGDPRELR